MVHLVRASLRYASKRDWSAITKALTTIYTAPTETAARQRFNELSEDWGERDPVVIRLWNNAWEQFTPFLAYPPQIRRVIYTTNMIESLNARFRQATRRRGHFPRRPSGPESVVPGRTRPPQEPDQHREPNPRMEKALNAFALHYGERITETNN